MDDTNKYEKEMSDIVNFYSDSVIFITGATGFLGKLLLEKLLRTCTNLKKVYLLIRSKKGKTTDQRFQEIFEAACFDVLKKEQRDYRKKVFLVNGDISQPDVGLSDDDKKIITSEVDVIFHCAATVRFDEPLQRACHINVRATRDLLRMAKQMAKLKAFVHISTAFSNCTRKDIDEIVYDQKLTGERLLSVCDSFDEDDMKKLAPIIVGEFPNTYVYTKAIGEEVAKSEGKEIPLAIIRPSIVISTVKEPVEGWIDNFYGATGVLVGACLGVIRSLRAQLTNKADLIPADYVINNAIAAAWDVATTSNYYKCEETKNNDDKHRAVLKVYNCVSSSQNPITWEEYMDLTKRDVVNIPSPHLVWYPCFAARPNIITHTMALFFLHTIPAYVVDFALFCIGKKTMMVKGYAKIAKFTEVIAYFAMREWSFTNGNVQQLWGRMKPVDKELFEFSVTQMDWDKYFIKYATGCRLYLLKDPLDTIPQGWLKYRKLQIAHYTLVTLLLLLMYKMLSFFWCLIFD